VPLLTPFEALSTEDGIKARVAGGHAELEAAAGEQVDGRRVLGQTDWILVTDGQHPGPEPDPARMLGDRRQQHERRGDVVVEVALTCPAAVEPDRLGVLEGLDRPC